MGNTRNFRGNPEVEGLDFDGSTTTVWTSREYSITTEDGTVVATFQLLNEPKAEWRLMLFGEDSVPSEMQALYADMEHFGSYAHLIDAKYAFAEMYEENVLRPQRLATAMEQFRSEGYTDEQIETIVQRLANI